MSPSAFPVPAPEGTGTVSGELNLIPGTGHRVAEDAPDRMLTALTAFPSSYRDAVRGS